LCIIVNNTSGSSYKRLVISGVQNDYFVNISAYVSDCFSKQCIRMINHVKIHGASQKSQPLDVC